MPAVFDEVNAVALLLKVLEKLGQENHCYKQAADVWREVLYSRLEHLEGNSMKIKGIINIQTSMARHGIMPSISIFCFSAVKIKKLYK